MVYSTDGIPGSEALAAERILAALLRFKMKQEYSKLCGFVRRRVSLEIVRYIILLLRGTWYKEAKICQQPEVIDGAVMVLPARWRG